MNRSMIAVVVTAMTGALCGPSAMAQMTDMGQGKVEIVVSNSRHEPITMRFDYAFRDYTWKLMEHEVEADGGEITYRFPANIPGCERMRDWHITDGILSISNSAGQICQKRISLCDKIHTTMEVLPAVCNWRQRF